jgi:hypothetical protein
MRVRQSRVNTFLPSVLLLHRMKIELSIYFGKTVFKINLSPSRKFFIHVISFVEMSLKGKKNFFRFFFSISRFSLSRAKRFQCALLRIHRAERKKNRMKLFSLLLQKKREKMKAEKSDFPLNHYSEGKSRNELI